MASDVKKLSNKAPIILTWVPRIYGAFLPNGKNSALNYLEIIKNHKLKEERNIYLVINGPGFEENQIDDLKRELEGIGGVHVIDLHECDWSKIDTGWKIDGKDISIKDFFRDMYSMQEEQRMYFAVEIDTFRLIALAFVKQLAKQSGAVYIDFDSLKFLNDHIGKNITIPKDILLGHVGIAYNPSQKKVVGTNLNNDLIAISSSSVAVDILSEYKAKILSQRKVCNELINFVPFLRRKLDQHKESHSSALKGIDDQLKRATILKEGVDRIKAGIDSMKADVESGKIDNAQAIILEKELTILKKKSDNVVREWMKAVNLEEADGKMEDVIKNLNEAKCVYTRDLNERELQEKCLTKFSDNPTIKGLYEPDIIALINDPHIGLNLGHRSILSRVDSELMGSRERDKWKLFSFSKNNGNYVPVNESSDLSWTKEDLYCEQRVSSKLEEVKVAMKKLSLKQLQI